jgi:hypothetical protein
MTTLQRGRFMEYCNVEKYIKGLFFSCGKAAKYKHPRYPDGYFCEKCKEDVASFFPKDWSLIEENIDKTEI